VTTPSGQFHRDTKHSSIYRDLQKHMPTLTPLAAARGRLTATNQTAGPLAQIVLRINELATRHDLLNFNTNCIICYIIWTLPSLTVFKTIYRHSIILVTS